MLKPFRDVDISEIIASKEEDWALKKVQSSADATARATGSAYGAEVNKFMHSVLNDSDANLSNIEKVHASNSTILGAKIQRKVAQGYKAKGSLARIFNDFGNITKDAVLEFGAGSIVKSM